MKKTAVVFWSGTGNTESMANAVLEGMKAAGAEAELFTSEQADAAKLAGFDWRSASKRKSAALKPWGLTAP